MSHVMMTSHLSLHSCATSRLRLRRAKTHWQASMSILSAGRSCSNTSGFTSTADSQQCLKEERNSAAQTEGASSAAAGESQKMMEPVSSASQLETAGSNSVGSLLESVSSFASLTTTSR